MHSIKNAKIKTDNINSDNFIEIQVFFVPHISNPSKHFSNDKKYK